MNKIVSLLVLCAFHPLLMACETAAVYPDQTFPEVMIKTNKGDIVVELDRNRAPITVNNFLWYVKSGRYVKTIFHRVQKDFVIQGGGYDQSFEAIEDCQKIFNESGNGLKNTKGTIAMARYDDPHSATSQFYFNLTDTPSLDPNAKNWGYTVFGEVVEGMEVLQKIADIETGFSDKLSSANVPIEPIIISEISVQ